MASTDQIRAAIAEADRLLAGGVPAALDHRPLFPELARRDRASAPAPAIAGHTAAPPHQIAHPRPTQATAEVALDPRQVATWSGELGFTSSPTDGRITRAND